MKFGGDVSAGAAVELWYDGEWRMDQRFEVI
jgi:hypothetical protein